MEKSDSTTQQLPSAYYDLTMIQDGVCSGRHRDMVGGLWDEIGRLQFDFLVENGLVPQHKLLDLGCGCLRGGIHFIRFLEPAHYFGIDANQSLLDAGLEIELPLAGLVERLPRSNVYCDRDFKVDVFGQMFDTVISVSLFTHLPAIYLRVCLEKLATVVKPGGRYFATFFLVPDEHPFNQPYSQSLDITSNALSDPYHYRLSDIYNACHGLPWNTRVVGSWGHPRNQQMIVFERQPDMQVLRPGDDYYRAYVGPAERYDVMGASQFALLYKLGLREHHYVLDFGCGSLRLGRLLIPWLLAGRYFGIDPNQRIVDEAVTHELGQDAIRLKQPAFSCNADFDCTVFGRTFDFVVAQSILTHCGTDLCRLFFEQLGKVLLDDGIAVFSYLKVVGESGQQPADGWHYPACVGYTEAHIAAMVKESGLFGVSLPWYHPEASWYAVARSAGVLPNAEAKRQLQGRPLTEPLSVKRPSSVSNPRVPFADEFQAACLAAEIGTGKACLVKPFEGVLVAGETSRLVFEYVAGRSTVATGGRIRFCFHHLCTWSPAQTGDVRRPGFVQAVASNGTPLTVRAWGDDSVSPRTTMQAHFPWQHCIEVVVGSPGLYEGDSITVTYGAGDAQARVQSFAAADYPFRVFLDPQCTGYFLPAEEHPQLSVVGAAASRLVVVTPSDHGVGGAGWVLVRLEDQAGNLASGFKGEVMIEGDVLTRPLTCSFTPQDQPFHRFTDIPMQPSGLCRLVARTDSGLVAQSNPFRVWPDPGLCPSPILWGELHGHSCYSDGYGTPSEYFEYARFISGLDVAALTDHDFMLSDVRWAEIKRVCNQYNTPGEFVTLQAFEWSGESSVGGDRNMYFVTDDPPICRSRTLYDYNNPSIVHGTDSRINHVEDLYAWLDEQVDEHEVLVVPHWGGRPASPQWINPRYDKLLEVFSEHRRSEDWTAEFTATGVKFGVIAGGDDHSGRPGNGFLAYTSDMPDFSGPQALVAVRSARERTEVFDALRQRCTYATTGARIIVDFEMQGHTMGSVVTVSAPPVVSATVMGTAHIAKVELLCDGQVVRTVMPAADPSAVQFAWQVDFPLTDVPRGFVLRVEQEDGHIALTSPIWAQLAGDVML